jgi:rhodanese-related sulfurtransferase
VVRGAAGDPPLLFTGGALIAGGAARTDLVSPELTQRLTRDLFRTLHGAFDHLPDETLLLPTHGAGSFCSAGASRDATTLGAERATNPLIAEADEDRFVRGWPATFPATPAYFVRMRPTNAAGPRLVREIEPPPPLEPEAFDRARRAGALVVDCRDRADYAAAHVPDSLAIPYRDAFCTWLGWLVPANASLLFVVDPADLDGVVDASLLVGYERFGGWLEGGLEAWQEADLPVRSLPSIGPEDAVPWLEAGALPLDVREPDEYEMGNLSGSELVPLGSLERDAERLPRGRPLLTYCGAGFRSVTAASILERLGRGPVLDLRGGYGAWRDAHRD